ncbi:MAG: hypothetical protein OXG47_08665 [bacterium]|nr:hypothetical protein [bacterium]
MGRSIGSWARRTARGATRRDQRGAFAADWLLVIAAVAGLGGISAYLVEENLESLTVEQSAQQRDTTAYLDGGLGLNSEHRTIRRALATAEQIVEEAVSADPDDPRFPTWRHWADHFDAKCRRLKLSYANMDGFTVTSLFLPPLWDHATHGGEDWYKGETDKIDDPSKTAGPSKANAPLTAAELRAADTTPYPEQSADAATVAVLRLLSTRKIIVAVRHTNVPGDYKRRYGVNHWQELIRGNATFRGLHQGAVAWCFLPRSVSATLSDGTWDNDNLEFQAARDYARGVAQDAASDDRERPGDKSLPGTWQNWQDYWTAKCLRAPVIFSDLKGFTVEADFTRPAGARPSDLIYDRQADHEPFQLKNVELEPNPGNNPRPEGTASCELRPA